MPITADNRPTDYEYAVLSQQAYNINLKKGSSVDVLSGWKVKLVRQGGMDFRVVIFENAETKQWVVSYKGTDSIKSLLEDVIGIVESGDSPQKAEAFRIVMQIIQGAEVSRLPAGYQLSFTGHSLGAFLALMSLYYAHTLKADWPSLHAVVFECPGMAASFKMIESHGRVINPLLLDIVNYVSYPNIINTFDSHIGGTLYTAAVDLGAWGNWSGWYTKKAHSIDGFVEYLNPNQPQEHPLHCLSDWPINGASVIGGERGVYFEQARFDEEKGRYVIDKEEEDLISTAPDKLYDKTRKLVVEGHYHILAEDVFTPRRCLRLRHFAPGFQQFLGIFHGMKGFLLSNPELTAVFKNKAKTLGISELIVELLLSYELKQDVDAQWFLTLTLASEMGITPYQFRKDLSHWLANGGEAKTSQLIISLAQGEAEIRDDRIKVVAEVIAQGTEVHGMVICNTVEGIGLYFTNENEKEGAKDLLTHLGSVVKEVEVYIIAPGTILPPDAIVAYNHAIGVGIHSGTAQSQIGGEALKLLAERIPRHGVVGSSSSSSDNSVSEEENEAKKSLEVASNSSEITGLSSSTVIAVIPPGASVSGNLQNNIVIGTYADSVFAEPRKTLNLSEVRSWQLVNEIEHFVAREDLMKKIQSRLSGNTENTIVLSVLRGMGGIGKSTLANHIIHDTQSSFKAWFNAESISNLQSQYVDLGLACQLYTVKDKLPIDVMVNRVLRHLEACPGWILVYDNVEKYEDIKPLLPQKGGHVIITSRHHNWPKDSIIPVDVMEAKEAIDLVKKVTETKEEDIVIEELVNKTLGLLPLAISQACGYIKTNENMLIEEYISLYDQYAKELLASDKMPPGDIHPSVYVTFTMNFQKIEKNSQYAPILLNVCSFLDASDIPEEMLLKYFEEQGMNRFNYNNAKMASAEYSLIKINEKSISIHRLVQETIVFSMAESVRVNRIKSIAKEIDNSLHQEADDIDARSTYQKLFPHVMKILFWSKKFAYVSDILISLIKKISLYIQEWHNPEDARDILQYGMTMLLNPNSTQYKEEYVRLYTEIGHIDFSSGRLADGIRIYEECLDILQGIVNKTDSAKRMMVDILICIGAFNCRNKELDKGADRYREAIEILDEFNQESRNMHWLTQECCVMYNIAISKRITKDCQGALKIFLDVLAKQQAIHEIDHNQIANIIDTNIAIAKTYIFMKEHSKGLEYFLQAEQLTNTHFNDRPNHYLYKNVLIVNGLVCFYSHDIEKAKYYFEEAKKRFGEHLGVDQIIYDEIEDVYQAVMYGYKEEISNKCDEVNVKENTIEELENLEIINSPVIDVNKKIKVQDELNRHYLDDCDIAQQVAEPTMMYDDKETLKIQTSDTACLSPPSIFYFLRSSIDFLPWFLEYRIIAKSPLMIKTEFHKNYYRDTESTAVELDSRLQKGLFDLSIAETMPVGATDLNEMYTRQFVQIPSLAWSQNISSMAEENHTALMLRKINATRDRIFELTYRIKQDSRTGAPLFIFHAFEESNPAGTIMLYGHPILCRSEDGLRNNIIHRSGIFEALTVETENLSEVCEVLPPDEIAVRYRSMRRAAAHGALNGASHVIEKAMRRQGVSEKTSQYTGKALYYLGYWFLSFIQHYQEQGGLSQYDNTQCVFKR